MGFVLWTYPPNMAGEGEEPPIGGGDRMITLPPHPLPEELLLAAA